MKPPVDESSVERIEDLESYSSVSSAMLLLTVEANRNWAVVGSPSASATPPVELEKHLHPWDK